MVFSLTVWVVMWSRPRGIGWIRLVSKAWGFLVEALGNISANGCNAVNTEGDRALGCAVGSPRVFVTVILTDVVGDQIKVGRDHPPAKCAGLADVNALINLIRVPDQIGLCF